MSRSHTLALDLGSTGVRARLFGPDGAVAASAYRTLPVAFPGPGRVEQDPLGLERASEAVLREALCSAGCTAADVAGLGIATQRATALAWDAGTRRPIAPAVGWQDQRRASALDRLNAQGIPLTSQAAVAKFLWWLEHDAPVKEAARRGTLRLGTPDVWLGDRLSGGSVYVTDPGHAHNLTDPGHSHTMAVQFWKWGGTPGSTLSGPGVGPTSPDPTKAPTGVTVNSGPTGITVANAAGLTGAMINASLSGVTISNVAAPTGVSADVSVIAKAGSFYPLAYVIACVRV